MIKYLVVLIILLSANLAAAYAPGDMEWAAGVSGTLTSGSTLINGEYKLKAVQFPSAVPGIRDINRNLVPETAVEPFVLIEVYKNGVLLNTVLMDMHSDPYIDPDNEIRITATDFPATNSYVWIYDFYSPWATISIQKRGLPEFDVSVTTDKYGYTSYDDTTITATATVKNRGYARANFVDLNLNIGDLQLRGGGTSQLHQQYITLEAGASQSFSVILEVPKLIDQKSYTFSVDAKGHDIKDLEFKANSTSSIVILPKPVETRITISKTMKDRIYLQDPAIVSINIGNGGIYEIRNINVTDSINDHFELKSNTSLQWDIPVLKPGQEWGTTYFIKALDTSFSGFSIPNAKATFTLNNQSYNIHSWTNAVVVYGPKITLEKTVNKPIVNPGEDVIVTVSINNLGNTVAYVSVNDSLPVGVSLVNGTTSIDSTSLGLNTPETFSYTIRLNKEGEIKLPSAVAKYTGFDDSGMKRSELNSQMPLITVINPGEVTSAFIETPVPSPTLMPPKETIATPLPSNTPEPPLNIPEPTPTPKIPGFNIILAFIVLIIVALQRHK